MIAIAGSPRAGKTTLAKLLTAEPRSTDETLSDTVHGANPNSWSDASSMVSLWFNDPDIKVIEGVVVPRALRKWLKANKRRLDKQPVTSLIYLPNPLIDLSKGQETMGKGCWTVFEEILPDLICRGVNIHILKKIPERLSEYGWW